MSKPIIHFPSEILAEPIMAQEFAQLMAQCGPFEEKPQLVIAVSGGADSLALCLLLKEWATAKSGTLYALTIDHQLRSSSGAEAKQVSQWLKEHAIKHITLPWVHHYPHAALQEKARKGRYDLLISWCRNQGIVHLFTAHHLHDQMETFFQRLAKGSHLTGLCAIQPVTLQPYTRILRPLLPCAPNRLLATLKRFNQHYIEDPSNRNAQFERVRWRAMLPQLTDLGIKGSSLSLTIQRLQSIQNYFSQEVTKALMTTLTASKYGFVTLQPKLFFKFHKEVRLNLLAKILKCLGGRYYPLKEQKLLALDCFLHQNQSGKSFTCGGCLFFFSQHKIYICREVRNTALQPISHTHFCWDARFSISLFSPFKDYQIGFINTSHLRIVQEKLNLPLQVVVGLPAIYGAGTLKDIPHLSGEYLNISQACFHPKYPLEAN